VIHRDIKPANVMIDSGGTTKIMDFGIARISDTRTCTPTGMVMGTVEYMAPEQILGEELDGRADQFALAVVAYQMMTGSTLFGPNTLATLTYKIVNEAAPLPRTRNAALPPGVDAVLAKALAKKPAERFATCSEFSAALADAFSDAPTAPVAVPIANIPALTAGTTVALPPAAAVAEPLKTSRAPLIAAAIAVVVLAGALAAVILKPWKHMPEAPSASAALSPPATVPTITPPATAPAEPLPTTGPEALKPPAGATPAPSTPAQTAPEIPQGQPKQPAQPAKAEATEPPKVVSGPPKTVAPPVAPSAQMAVEPPAEEFPVNVPEPKTKSGPSPFQQALQHGQQQVKAKDYVNALHSFGDAVALKPESAQAHYSRGFVFEHFQQYDAAIRDFQEAIRLEPTLVMAYSQMGACLEQQHRDPEALVEFQRALELNPTAQLALFGRGNVYLRRRQFAAAAADYSKLLQINPRYAPAYQNRAVARQAMGDFAGAAEDKRAEQSLRK
jgi:Flp pilus assembly protein TadD